MVAPRSILKAFLAIAQEEGVGAQVRRSIGTMKQRNFPPFLMLDHFNVKAPAGFPDHPHYGFSTVTYIMDGMMAHEDFTGSTGVLRPGDLQFMTAGKGIVHSEIPVKTHDDKACIGMQLWVDLPQELKDCEPLYRDLKREEIPIAKPDDLVTVKVIAGEAYGVKSVQNLAKVAVDYYDYDVAPGGEFVQPFPESYNVFLYVLEGSLEVNGTHFDQYNAVFFKQDGDSVCAKVPESQTGNTRVVVIGGAPLDQPVVQHGPFVATSREKIYDTFMNYQSGKNGFEKARGWYSKIGGGISEDDLKKETRDEL
jgi:redox-sensitive bicupin YhaK (pirin superfamily)